MKAEQVILSRLLPKTGQTAVNVAGDDADLAKGWWKNQCPISKIPRFVDKTTDEDHKILDRATGLMWASVFNSGINYGGIALNWIPAIAYPRGREWAGFRDWRIPNIFELFSIINFGNDTPAVYTEFFGVISGLTFWSSTTYQVDINKAFAVAINYGSLGGLGKTNAENIICVRDGV